VGGGFGGVGGVGPAIAAVVTYCIVSSTRFVGGFVDG